MGLRTLIADIARETYTTVIGRPRQIEGEQGVVSDGLMASMVRPGVGGVYFLPVDEIIRRKGWQVYKDMLHDEQIKQCLRFKKLLIHGREWEIQPADSSPKAKEVAAFVQWNMERLNFNRVFEAGLSCLEFGYSWGEIVWGRAVYPGDGEQKVVVNRIAHRDPQRCYLEMDWHGNFTGHRQISMGQNILLPPQKGWFYTYNERFGDIYGESDLRSAYRSWWAKKFIINFWNVFLERLGQPMMLMKYPQGASDDLKAILKKILTNLSSKTEVLVPAGVEVNLIEATRAAGNGNYEGALKFHNSSIAKAILMSTIFSEADSTRVSQDIGFVHLRMLFKMTDMIAQDMVKSFMDQVVRQLIAFNYGEENVEKLLPKFIWQDYGQYSAQLIADEIRQLHAAGIIEMDQSDVNYVRSILGLPIRDPDDHPDKVIRPVALPLTGQGAAKPPPPDQGNKNASKGGGAAAEEEQPAGPSTPGGS